MKKKNEKEVNFLVTTTKKINFDGPYAVGSRDRQPFTVISN